MTPLPAAAERYLDKFAVKGPWSIDGSSRHNFAGAVVIPALAESDSLFATLQCLETNPPRWQEAFLVLVVVNHGEQASADDKRQNLQDLARLIELSERTELPLAWVDAASPGFEVPARQAGVGFARKLGLDLALSRLNWQELPLLVCLDADTLVEKNYLQTIVAHFQSSTLGAAVLPFCHQPAGDAAHQAAIDRYELFLRSYVLGLRLAGSPYAFNSVGSAMACRAEAYVRTGGMNSRKAGEDFYFLQGLAKTDGVGPLFGTTVFPEPRVSARAPFGTGRSMGRLLNGDTQGVLFYPSSVFRVLAAWLSTVEQHLRSDAGELLRRAFEISPVLAGYLEQSKWLTTWPRLQLTHQDETRRRGAFHAWFDGFRTMRLVHELCDAGLSRGEPEQALPDLFAWAGRSCPATVPQMLDVLRSLDGGLYECAGGERQVF